MTGIRTSSVLAVLVATTALTATAVPATGAPTTDAGMFTAASAGPSTPAATTAPRIRSLAVGVSRGVTTMPTRLMAGTYYVHLTTLDAGASLQVVRPPSTLSLASWYARYLACATHSPGESYATSVRQCRYWRTSATFVGGANVVRVSTYDQLVNPGGRATFAITLAPGRYWFYADTGGAPQLSNGKPLPRIRIRTVTVVGASQRAAVPVAAVLRFPPGSVSFPRLVPRRGFVLGIGEPGVITVLVLLRRKSWVTDADLVPGQCFPDSGGASQALQCFDGYVRLGGGVSAGASALWWYDLPAGDYIAFQGGLDEAGDSGLYPTPTFARVTVG